MIPTPAQHRRLFVALLTLTLVACGTDDGSDGSPSSGASDAGAAVGDGGTGVDPGDQDVGDQDVGDQDVGDQDVGSQSGGTPDTAAAAEVPAKPIAYSAGSACPTLVKGDNSFWSWGETRKVDIYLPKDLPGTGLLFLWHGLGDNKENFGAAVNAQHIANTLQAIVAVPQGGLKMTGWGWGSMDDSTEDAALFDDLLTCVGQQFAINNKRVWSMGFSAGALWTSWLVVHRSTFLASAVAWSGGTGANSNKYATPKRKIPVLLAWGGPKDTVMLNFETTTLTMAKGLRADGHFVVTCNHGLGHTIPPGGLTWGLDFLQRHTFGVNTSDLATDPKVQQIYPDYCSYK